MNIDSAHRHIRAVVEEALPETTATAVLSNAAFLDRHTDALIHQVSSADPDGTNDEAVHDAMSTYAATIREELRKTHREHYIED